MEQKELVTLITKQVVDALNRQEMETKVDNLYGPARYSQDGKRLIPLAISVRHLHLCEEDQDILFGQGYQMTPRNAIYQKGYFACHETVEVIGPNQKKYPKMRIISPFRPKTQVELARTDAIFLGLDLEVGVSVQHVTGQEVTIIGPKGTVKRNCAIIPSRHIHFHPNEAKEFGIVHEQKVKVYIPSNKPTLFENVYCRVHEDFRLEMHLDTDDGNGALIKPGIFGILVK